MISRTCIKIVTICVIIAYLCDDISCVVHEVNVTVFHVLYMKCAKTEI